MAVTSAYVGIFKVSTAFKSVTSLTASAGAYPPPVVFPDKSSAPMIPSKIAFLTILPATLGILFTLYKLIL
jgi:hypothetical protein